MINNDLITKYSKIIEDVTRDKAETKLLQQWKKSKEHIYYGLFDQELKKKFSIDVQPSRLQRNFAKKKFINRFKKYTDVIEKIDSDSLFSNQLKQNVEIQGHQYKKGMKVSKVLNKIIVSTEDQIEFERSYSNFLNSFNTKGTLCLSIDPIDFLTMSDNNYNWSTCCNLLDGEFKSSVLSLIADDKTILCYIEGDKPFEVVDGVFVSNKKWRVLTHFCSDTPYLVFNKEYPFENNFAIIELSNIFKNLLQQKYNREFIYCTYAADKFLGVKFDDKYDDGITYHDLIRKDREGRYLHKKIRTIVPFGSDELENLKTMLIGENPSCTTCNSGYVTACSSFQCNDCNGYEYCCTCGKSFDLDDLLNFADEELYCEDCYDEEFVYCDLCDHILRASTSRLYGCENCEEEEEEELDEIKVS